MEKTINIALHSVKDVKDFVNVASKIDGAANLCSGRYIIDAKSFMGIFSLDLTKPLTLEVENWKEEYALMLEKYMEK